MPAGDTLRRYAAALRDEPKLRYYFLWTLFDDAGTAIAAWGGIVFVATYIRTPADMSRIAVPMLAARLVGALIAGPLADWPTGQDPERLKRWRYKIVFWRYLAFFLLGLAIVLLIATGSVTMGRLVVYFVAQQLLALLGSATSQSFLVDLLQVTDVQRDAGGEVLRDESGQPKEYKVHLLTGISMLDQVQAAAQLAGLIIGGSLLAWVHGRFWVLLAVDVASYLIFALGAMITLHPQYPPSAFELRWILPEPEAGVLVATARERTSLVDHTPRASTRPFVLELARVAVTNATDSIRTLVRFLADRENRTFAILVCVGWFASFAGTLYEARLLLTNVLGRGMEFYRKVQIAQMSATVAMYVVVVALAAQVQRLGLIYAASIAFDGVVMAVAGFAVARALAAHAYGAVFVYAAVVAFTADSAVTVTSRAFAGLAAKSVSSLALRGRILGGIVLVNSVIEMAGAQLYPTLSGRLGQPMLLACAGLAQVAIVLVLCLRADRGPAGFRIRVEEPATAHAAPERAA